MNINVSPVGADAHLCNGILHNFLVRHIALITNEQFVHTLCSVAIDFLKPLLDVVERVHICHIVDDTDAVGTAVVGGSDGSESLLACGIPLAPRSAFSVQISECELSLRSEASLSCRQVRSFGFSVKVHQPLPSSIGNVCQGIVIQSQRRWSRCSSRYTCHPQTATASRTFQLRNHQ